MMISTDGVADVPVGQNGNTNAFGIAVMPSVPSYYRSSVSIDVDRLPDDIEMGDAPVVEAALTEGAIGFRRIDVLKGEGGGDSGYAKWLTSALWLPPFLMRKNAKSGWSVMAGLPGSQASIPMKN